MDVDEESFEVIPPEAVQSIEQLGPGSGIPIVERSVPLDENLGSYNSTQLMSTELSNGTNAITSTELRFNNWPHGLEVVSTNNNNGNNPPTARPLASPRLPAGQEVEIEPDEFFRNHPSLVGPSLDGSMQLQDILVENLRQGGINLDERQGSAQSIAVSSASIGSDFPSANYSVPIQFPSNSTTTRAFHLADDEGLGFRSQEFPANTDMDLPPQP